VLLLVGILVVSHSIEIAQGVEKLARQMVGDSFPLQVVGGTKDGQLGTEADSIREALEDLDQGDGVIVLADMGSAVMNVEFAFDLFPSEQQDRFAIANAPVVEGTISAALQAKTGKKIKKILTFLEKEEDFCSKVSK